MEGVEGRVEGGREREGEGEGEEERERERQREREREREKRETETEPVSGCGGVAPTCPLGGGYRQ